jgi:hypothetical protein
VHPSAADTEWVIQTASDAVSDTKVLYRGTVDAAGQKVTGLEAYALIYVVGGDVRRVPLQANGQAPAGQVQRSGTSSACAFQVDAIDYANPENSRFIASTAGADGVCGTSDDGRAEVRLSASSPQISVTPIAGAAPLTALRDPATLAPRAWLFPTAPVLWDAAAGTPSSLPTPINGVVASNFRSVLAQSSSGLSLIDSAGGTSFTQTALTTAAPTGWQALGFDGQYFYSWRNSGDESGSWQVIRVARINPASTVMASGSGRIAVASVGKAQIYLTVFTPADNRLLRLPKAVPGATPTVLETTSPTTLTTVTTSNGTVHQRWRVTNIGSASQASIDYKLDLIDESGATVRSGSSGGFPLVLLDAASLDFNASENRSVFLFVEGYGARAFGDASMVSCESAASTAKAIGSLPGSSSYGSDYVFANVNGGGPAGAAGYAARSINGVIQGAGAKVFSFDPAVASSLKLTSKNQ